MRNSTKPLFNLKQVFSRLFGKSEKEKTTVAIAVQTAEAETTKEKRMPKGIRWGGFGDPHPLHFGTFSPNKLLQSARKSFRRPTLRKAA